MNAKAPLAAMRALRQLRHIPGPGGTIAVGGARELVPLLARELRAGGEAAAVTVNRADGHPVALVWIGKADETTLRAATRNGIPVVAVTEGDSLPYVLDTNIVRALPGHGLPVQEVLEALARVLGDRGPGVAARLPALRPAVVAELSRRAARRNALIGAAAFLKGADLPALTLNQAVLVTRMAVASGRRPEPAEIWPELAGVLAAGLAARELSRLLRRLPVAGFVVDGAVAFAGTAALGSLLRRRFR